MKKIIIWKDYLQIRMRFTYNNVQNSFSNSKTYFLFYFFHQLFEPILPKYMVSISKSVNIVSDRRIRLGQASAALENSAQWFSRSPLRWRRSRTLLVWLCFGRFLRMVDRLRLNTFSNNNLKQGHWNDAKWANISHFHDGKKIIYFTCFSTRIPLRHAKCLLPVFDRHL